MITTGLSLGQILLTRKGKCSLHILLLIMMIMSNCWCFCEVSQIFICRDDCSCDDAYDDDDDIDDQKLYL